MAALALTGNLLLAVGLAFGTGVGNLAFVIPSQTLFQRRTPPELMGRVLGFRFSLVFGSMTLAMGVGRDPESGGSRGLRQAQSQTVNATNSTMPGRNRNETMRPEES